MGLASLAAPALARADYFGDMWNGSSEKLCPLLFGAGCRTTLSADVVLAYQHTRSDDTGVEPYLRAGAELGLGQSVAPNFQIGPVIEFGSQDGRFMSGFHIVPKARARYWLGGSPVSVDAAIGGYYGRSWLDSGDAQRNRLGLQIDGGLGLLGSLHFVGGFAVLADPGGVYGLQTQAFVGARLSVLVLVAAVGLGLKR